MRKGKFLKETLDILTKIFFAFVIVFSFYFVSEKINNFAFDYFIFPLVSIITIFICGINVGRSLEKLKTNEPIGFFTKRRKNDESEMELSGKTEFIVNDNSRVVTNKKILKEVEEGNQIHIKVFNYNDLIEERESG